MSEATDQEIITKQQFEYYKFQVDFMMKEFMRKEEEIRATNQELREQRNDIFKQKQDLERKTQELQKVIEDHDSSILYASYIQSVILGNQDSISDFFKELFILYKPKGLVSGDFYWFHEIDENRGILAIGDCAGHGVPGALMTTLNISLLNEIIIKEGERNPNFVLNHLDMRLTNALKGYNEMAAHDGLDISILYYDKKLNVASISSTYQSSYHFRKNKLNRISGAKIKLGQDDPDRDKIFAETTFYVKPNDYLFFSTDGYINQLNMDEQKFGATHFEDLILKGSELSLIDHKEVFERELNEWKGSSAQSDDVLLVGIKI
ncbi:MAG: SpoIIE family protein phosphatase [Cyclobacteriaceae bacterium]